MVVLDLRPSLCCIAALLLAPSCAETWNGGIHARMLWSKTRGVRVVEVPTDSPAEQAGLEPNDRIVAVDGWPVKERTAAEVRSHLQGPVGSYVQLKVERNGKEMTLRVERAPYEGD